MSVFAMDLALLRDVLLPELRLTPGRMLMARVVSADGDGRGALSIAGYLIGAELPRGVRAGDDLRLEVRDVDAQRVLLAVASHADEPAPLPLPAAVSLPGGATLSVTEDPGGGPGPRSPGGHTLSLRLDTPALGTIDLRFELDPAALRVGVAIAPGDPLTRAQEQASSLRQALADSVERSVTVTVSPRHEPLEIYA